MTLCNNHATFTPKESQFFDTPWKMLFYPITVSKTKMKSIKRATVKLWPVNLVQLDVMFLFMHRHLTMRSFGVAMQVQLANDTRKQNE